MRRIPFNTLWLLLLTLTGIYLVYQLALPFLSIITWATALAVLFSPIQAWLEKRVGSRSLSALVCTLFIGMMVIIPAIFATTTLASQIVHSAQWLEEWIASEHWKIQFKSNGLSQYADKIYPFLNLPNLVTTMNNWLISNSAGFLRNSTINILTTALVFYLLFFLLRDRTIALQALRHLLPLDSNATTQCFLQLHATIKAIMFGTFTIALLQGALGGVMFWALGLPAPLLWGSIMALASIMPMLGAFIIWVPAVIYLAMVGDWGKAMTLALWGGLIISSIDNWLRPYLVGSQLNLHPMLIFFSIAGGVIMYGPSGLLLGPIAVNTTRFLMQHWATQNRPSTKLETSSALTRCDSAQMASEKTPIL